MHKKTWLAGGLLLIIGLSLGSMLTLLFQPASPSLQKLFNYEQVVKSKFVAVDEHGNGVLGDLVTEVRDGHGLVLVNVDNVLADISTQYSARLAAIVASNYTNIDVSNLDIIYNLKSNAGVVSGQSAGSIMAVSTIAALTNKTLKSDVLITGSINANGDVVDAGGLRAKAEAAKEAKGKIFLVPKGSGSIILNMTRTETCGTYHEKEYCVINYPGELVSIGEDLGVEVIEVDTVAEAMRYFL